MRFKLTLFHKGLFLIAFPLIFEIAFVVYLGSMFKQAAEEAERQQQSKEVVAEASTLSKLLLQAGYALISWKELGGTVGGDYDENVAKVSHVCHRLDELSLGDLRRRRHVEQIKSLSYSYIALTSKLRHHSPSEMLMYPGVYRVVLERIFGLLGEVQTLVDEEAQYQEANPALNAEFRGKLYAVLAFFVAFNVLLTVLMAISFYRGITRRLSVLSDNSTRLARRQKLNEPVAGTDEIAQLDLVFHDMADSLTKAEQRKQEFVSMITHDLRTPLTTVQTTVSMIGDYLGDPIENNMKRVASAKRNIFRMISLINQLLDIDKIEAGMLNLHMAATDLNSVIERSVESVHDFAQEKRVQILHETTQVQPQADEDRLVQVLVNFLSNAIKFSPSGSTISIAVQSKSQCVEIRVKDQGSGIPKADLQRVFDRFQQVDNDDGHAAVKGTGLGLAICKALIEAHRGAIGVESEVGVGSTFWFTVPLSDTDRHRSN